MKRSHTTHLPWSSAGAMVERTWSSRAAANSSVSATGPSGFAAPERSTWRMMSAPAEPPGSRVTTTPTASARSRTASRSACVDLPAPSPPSRVMNRPRIRTSLYLLGAGKKKPDHELGGGVEGAPRDAALGDGFGRMQRHLEHEVVAAPDLQLADRLAFLHRRAHRAVVDDARQDALARSLRHQQVDAGRRLQRHAPMRPAEHLRVADVLPLGEQVFLLEPLEAPFEQALARVGALV